MRIGLLGDNASLLRLAAAAGLHVVGVSPRGSGLSCIRCSDVPSSGEPGRRGEVCCSPRLCDGPCAEDVVRTACALRLGFGVL